MKLTRLVGVCEDGDCPTVYTTDRGTLAIQGDDYSKSGALTPTVRSLPESLSPRTTRRPTG